ncbi:zinc finger CCCH domain-containing protein 55-like isoform X2 [Olea europaea var. sylvestris]|uniref:zinc finger CCCH domain-containing protein 55-like isoform X2 n=1 Tax=Olea europaea var. sylvestris TaxID=158386 RepID=UPI000C1D4834|nr:zinc finger CCCH domain-containing protein 55-like isoform X2 [Olea europaea var. sylvestris]
MDIHEATKIVMSRIKSFDPENSSKIMGYILLQEQGEEELIRLAFGPESHLISYMNQAKYFLGLSSSKPSTPLSNLTKPNNPFCQHSPKILISNSDLHLNNNTSFPSAEFLISPKPGSYGSITNFNSNNGLGSSRSPLSSRFRGNDFGDEFISGGGVGGLNQVVQDQLSFFDDPTMDPLMSASGGSCSVNNDTFLDHVEDENDCIGFRWRPCLFYARGFCKNGSSCKFLHGRGIDVGSPSKIHSEFDKLLKIRAIQQQKLALMALGGHDPFAYNKCMNFLNENQRSAIAALTMGEEFHKFGCGRPDKNDYSAMGLIRSANSSSRQIYLTFPSDSTFKEEDVSNYFSMYGQVQDVRIPYQQKRMFGFVTFAFPETVKLILAKGNPHFVGDSRVLVKPYKEKGKVVDRKHQCQQHIEREEHMACLSLSELASREEYDLPLGSKLFCNAQDMMQRRKFEQEAELLHSIKLEEQGMMNFQLRDVKNQQYNQQLIPSLSVAALNSSLQSQPQITKSLDLPFDAINQEIPEEINGIQEAVGSDEKLPIKMTEVSDNNNTESENKEISDSEDSDRPESFEHTLPNNLFTSPAKFAAEHKSVFFQNSSEADSILVLTTTPNNIPNTSQHLGRQHGF